tara:strand:+ start:4227 stop:5285 length:1059 start_codon:yes stop_codon:yes gene_type:complete
MTTVRLVSFDDEKKLEKFYDFVYGEKHILNNTAHHDWQFLSNPYNSLNTKSIVVAEDNDQFVAHMGLIPVPVKIYNEIKLCAWHVSFFTLEEFRGMGLGTKMIQFSDSIFDGVGAMGSSDSARRIHIKNGGKNFDKINRYIKILNKKNVENFAKTKFVLGDNEEIIENETDFQRIKILNEQYENFWNVVKERFPITVNRTQQYLTWRFLENPLIDYHFMVLTKNHKILGYAVLRFEDQNKTLKAGRIVDFVSFENSEKILLKNIINYFRNKVDFIDFFCSGEFYKDTFEKNGFFNNFLSNYSIPTVFNPINNDRNSIDLHFKIKNFSTDNSKYYNYDNLFFIKSDADQDRAF